MMKLSTQPTLKGSDKVTLERWLIATLQHDKFENSGRSFPLNNRVAIFVENVPIVIRGGVWEKSSSNIYLAGPDDSVEMSDRLAILCTLAQYCDDSVELREAMQKAIMRYLLGEYQALSNNLVNSTVQPRGIAFSTTGGVASLFESGWITPSGESVDVSGDDWVVCASELPQPRVETIDRAVDDFERANEESLSGPIDAEWTPAFPETTTLTVGQRVRFSPSNNDGSQVTGEGIIIRGVLPDASMYQVYIDGTNDGAYELAYPSELELLPTREFRVGDRVRWTEIPGIGSHIGSGEVIEAGASLRVRDTTRNLIWIFTDREELLSHE